MRTGSGSLLRVPATNSIAQLRCVLFGGGNPPPEPAVLQLLGCHGHHVPKKNFSNVGTLLGISRLLCSPPCCPEQRSLLCLICMLTCQLPALAAAVTTCIRFELSGRTRSTVTGHKARADKRSAPHKLPFLIQCSLPLNLALCPVLMLSFGPRPSHAPRFGCHRCQACCQCCLASGCFCERRSQRIKLRLLHPILPGRVAVSAYAPFATNACAQVRSHGRQRMHHQQAEHSALLPHLPS